MSAASPAALYLLALSALRGIGPAALRKICVQNVLLLQPLSSGAAPGQADSLSALDLNLLGQLALAAGKRFNLTALQQAADFAQHQTQWAAELGISIICSLDAQYPALVRKTADDPVLFWAKGSLSCLNLPCAAVIGTREPTEQAKRSAAEISDYLIAQGLCIVSGLALGCDGIAHHQCVLHQAPTIAVLAHGLERIYPREHEHLALGILRSGGLLLSQFPLGTLPRAYQFVQRDFQQAALSYFTVLIQANDHGGSLNASGRSQLYGRPLVCAAPAQEDLKHFPERCRANLILTSEAFSAADKAALLRLPEDFDLAGLKLLTLHCREDYPQMLKLVARLAGNA
ncbi:MAG: DNA-protecting protein DprA [Proteobacteria bacterium]|uniref:DNA-protecting protein DprA n=1 Tax=Candidatus Avisuccinivibrio stercorigallinarum TaxID=2840704 RepID=A0A9D9D7Z1_9GAMM|nr:DNA-protecting protein DprA [Candidatus Avisuccinivibrio stercorigallinarum]